MLKRILVVLALCLVPSLAFGQTNECVNGGSTCSGPFTGTAIGNGVNIRSTTLFAASNALLQPSNPFSISYGVNSTQGFVASGTTFNFVGNRNNVTGHTGFAQIYFAGEDPGFPFQLFLGGTSTTQGHCGYGGIVCARTADVLNGNWNQICDVSQTNNLSLYLNGVLSDQNLATWTFSPGVTYLTVGNPGGFTAPTSIRELALWNRALGANECSLISARAYAGFSLNSGNAPASLSTGLLAYWNLASGTPCASGTCYTDSINGLVLTTDTAAPSVAITSPANGATGVNGVVTVAGTCSDAIACISVAVFANNASIGTATVSGTAWSLSWNSATVADGSNTITATATNAGNGTATATSTFTTSNSVSNKTVYKDPVAGSDSNSCLSSGAPCKTWAGVKAVINANPLIGGDQILVQHGTNENITSMTAATELVLCGPSGYALGAGCTQNVYPGKTITIDIYGGTGQCEPLAATTTDCASTTLSANGTVTVFSGIINVSNVPNLVIQHQRLFGNQTDALTCNYNVSGCAYGILYGSAGGYFNGGPNNTTSIAHNEVEGFGQAGILLGNTMAPTYPTQGVLCNATAQDNYLYTASISTVSDLNAALFMAGGNCGQGTSGPTGSSFISNYINNIAGDPCPTCTANGSGIQMANGNVNLVDNYNVTSNIGFNNITCGGPYGNWWFQVLGGLVISNESFNVSPGTPGGCDKGAFDLDEGVGGLVLKYNYGHETWGPSANVLTETVNGYTAGNNTYAYNIFEDGLAQTSNTNGAMIFSNAAVGFFNIYNNNIWNGYNGTTVSPNSFVTKMAALAVGDCAPGGTIVANNIVVANSVSAVASAEFYYGSDPAVFPTCAAGNIKFRSNDFWPVGTNTGSQLWRSVLTNLDAITSITAWNTAVSATDLNVNPQLSGTGGGAVQCYTALSGIPAQPGASGCPAAYVLAGGSAMIGVGTVVAGSPTADYFTNPVPNGVGTGINIGADGGNP
jgi:hypothetical protein